MTKQENEPILAVVRHALDPARRRLQAHGGDVEVASILPGGIVALDFTGACVGCPAKAMTVGTAIQPLLENLAGVTGITTTGINISSAALGRIRAMFELGTSGFSGNGRDERDG